MKNLKSLAIVMSALLAAQGGINPTVFAMESNSFAEEQSNTEGEKQTEDSGNEEMKEQIQEEILRMIFFRPDLMDKLKCFLSDNMKEEDIPMSLRTPEFLELLEKNDIMASDASKNVEEVENEKQERIKQIIEEDNLEEFQKETENNMDIAIEDSFFEVKYMRIPILHYCVMKKAIKCFKFLLLNGADPSVVLTESGEYRDWDCMSVAICFGEWEMMKILEERGINKFTNPNAWEAVALTHRNNLLKLFISNKDQIDNSLFEECLNKAMFGAAKGNNIKGLTILLNAGADINEVDYYCRLPLHVAAGSDATKAVEILIAKGENIKEKDDVTTLLYMAAQYDAYKVVEMLISKGADINVKEKRLEKGKMTLLHVAVENGAKRVAEVLINKGADINAKVEKGQNEGQTPLYIAVYENNFKLVEMLISKGADINAKSKCGWTPLHIALWNKNIEVAEILISKGADINAKNNEEETPLHIAIKKNEKRVAEVLINKGADINAKNIGGMTPMDIAKLYGRSEIVELLRSKGAVE